ncbi:uncharacterized protein [Littorina saxatilis]|uniref:Uncharacterized protein n=1 Tax=Littorina saxatilis TaxID=31220 RepID=A0AAN9G4J7_9CAEN
MGLKRRGLFLVIVVACVRYCVHCQPPFFPSSQQDLLRRNQLITSLPGAGLSTRNSVSRLPGGVGYNSFPSRYPRSPFSQSFGGGLSSPSTLGLLDTNNFVNGGGGGSGATGRIDPFSQLGNSREKTFPSLAKNHPFSSIRLNPVPTSKGVSLTRPQGDRFDRNRDRFSSLFDSDKARKYSLDAPSTFEKPITKTSLPDVNSPIELDLATDEQERVAYAKRQGQLPPSRRLNGEEGGEGERPKLHAVFNRGNKRSPPTFNQALMDWERPSSLPPMPGHATPTTTHFDRKPEDEATGYPGPAKDSEKDEDRPYFDDTAPFLEPPPKGTQAGVPTQDRNEPGKGDTGIASLQRDGSPNLETTQRGSGPSQSIVTSNDKSSDGKEFVPTSFRGRGLAEDEDTRPSNPFRPVHYTDSLDGSSDPREYDKDRTKSTSGSSSSPQDPEEEVVANVDDMIDALKAKAVGGAGGGVDPLNFPPPHDPLHDLPSAPLPTIPVDSDDVLGNLEIARAATEANAEAGALPDGAGTAFEGPGQGKGLADILKEARDVTGFGLDTSPPRLHRDDVDSNPNDVDRYPNPVNTHNHNDLPGDLESKSGNTAAGSPEKQRMGRSQAVPTNRVADAEYADQGESYRPVDYQNGAPAEDSSGFPHGRLAATGLRPANAVGGQRPLNSRTGPASDHSRGVLPGAFRPVNSRSRTTDNSYPSSGEHPHIHTAGIRPTNNRPINSRTGALQRDSYGSSRELPASRAGSRGSDGSYNAGNSGSDGSYNAGNSGSDGSYNAGNSGSDGSYNAGNSGSDGSYNAGNSGSDGSYNAGNSGSDGSYNAGNSGSDGSYNSGNSGSDGSYNSGNGGSDGSYNAGNSGSDGSYNSGNSGSDGSYNAGNSRSERDVEEDDQGSEYDEGNEGGEEEYDEGNEGGEEELFSLHERGESLDEDSVPPDRQHTPFETSHTDGDYSTPSAMGNPLDPSTPFSPSTEYTSPAANTSPGGFTSTNNEPSTREYTSPGLDMSPSPKSFPDDYTSSNPFTSPVLRTSPQEYTSAGVAASRPSLTPSPEDLTSVEEEMPSPQNETENATLSAEEERKEYPKTTTTEETQQQSHFPSAVDQPNNRDDFEASIIVPVLEPEQLPAANNSRSQPIRPPPPSKVNPDKQPRQEETTTTTGGRQRAENEAAERKAKAKAKEREKDRPQQQPSDLVSFEEVKPQALPPPPQPQPIIPTNIGRRRNPVLAENIGGAQTPGRAKVSPFEMMFGKSLKDAYSDTFGSLFGNLNNRAPAQPGALFSGGGGGGGSTGSPSLYTQGGVFGGQAGGAGGVFNDQDRDRGFGGGADRGFGANDRGFAANSPDRGFGTTSPVGGFGAGGGGGGLGGNAGGFGANSGGFGANAGGLGGNTGGFGASSGGFGSNVFGGKQLFDPNVNGLVNKRPSLRLFGGGR